jgi:hypothetical protein
LRDRANSLLISAIGHYQDSRCTAVLSSKWSNSPLSRCSPVTYLHNIFIERLWRSLKYEAVYLHEMTDGFVAGRVIAKWLDFYNTQRPHSSLDGQAPREAYWRDRPVDMMDKADALTTYPQAQQQQKDINLNSKKKLAA